MKGIESSISDWGGASQEARRQGRELHRFAVLVEARDRPHYFAMRDNALFSVGAQPALFILSSVAVAALVVLGLLLGLALGKRTGRLEAERGLPRRVTAEREDAVKRSRAVLGGQMSEQIAPFFPDFPYDPSEVRFLGKPVDFVVFVGASSGVVEEVVLVEVKSGNAGLSAVERSLRDAVEAGRVRFAEYRVPR